GRVAALPDQRGPGSDRGRVRTGLSRRQIGELIGREKSVVSREIRRNTGPGERYWTSLAHRVAHERRRQPQPFRL
ncbi:MAG TPA: hypothetical protein VFI30_03045, partial [Nocardioidaceae bacterium]|nr:hypothetical protein [Nocardioidaceae bacterium]